jgi:hypothetical protein
MIGGIEMNEKISKLGTMVSTMAVAALLAAASPAMAAKPAIGPKPSGGVIKVLDFNASWWEEFPLVTTSFPTIPLACQTEEYFAGDNEIAVVNMGGFLVTNTQNAVALSIRVATSNDGINFEPLAAEAEGLSAYSLGVANPSVSRTVPLQSGQYYSFAPAFHSVLYPVSNSWSRCSGTVTIVQQ